jgi:hypothetical protein
MVHIVNHDQYFKNIGKDMIPHQCLTYIYCDVYVTSKTGSSSDDWIYYLLVTHSLLITLIHAIQCCLLFTPITVHRCIRTRILHLH